MGGNVKHMCSKPLNSCKCYARIIVSSRQVIPLLCNNDNKKKEKKKKRMHYYFFDSLYSSPAAVLFGDVWVIRWLSGLGDLDALCSGRYEWQETWAACQTQGVSPQRTNLKDDSHNSWSNLSPGNTFAPTPVDFPAFHSLYWNCNHRCFTILWWKKQQPIYTSACAYSI